MHKLHFIYHRMLPYTSPWSDPISFNHFDVLLLRYHLKLWFQKFGLVLFYIGLPPPSGPLSRQKSFLRTEFVLSRIYVVPRKMLKEKLANFLWLHKYGVLETTFCNQVTFGPAGRGQMWSKLAKFHKGGLCQEQNEGKIHDTNKCQLQNVSHHFWVGLGLAPD